MGEARTVPPRTCPFDPPELLAELRGREPVAPVRTCDGRRAWLVTRYEDAYAVLRDRRFSADSADPGFPTLSPGRVPPILRRSFSRMDDPKHAELRQMVAHEFSAPRVELLRPAIRRVVDGLLDRLLAAGPPADLVTGLAQPVATTVLSDVIGIPPEVAAPLMDGAATVVSRSADAGRTAAADARMADLLDALATAREKEPDDTLIGRLVRAEVRRGALGHDELVRMVHLLVVAGYENPANMIGMGVLTMLAHPAWRAALAGPPARLAGLVDELLRYHSIANHDGLPRVATEDVTVGGVRIRAGDAVIVSLASANRDEASFPGAGTPEPHRDAHRHLAFGQGVHMCVGRWLARAEIEITLSTVATRIPALRLAVPVERIPFREDMHSYGVYGLPVAW